MPIQSTTPMFFPDPIKIIDFPAVGRRVVEWAQNPASRPRDIEEFKAQLADLLKCRRGTRKYRSFRDTTTYSFCVLPPKNQVTQSKKQLDTEDNDMRKYGIPEFYFDAIFG